MVIHTQHGIRLSPRTPFFEYRGRMRRAGIRPGKWKQKYRRVPERPHFPADMHVRIQDFISDRSR